MPWYMSIVISVSLAAVVAFVIYGYRWMDDVQRNHLKHIQEACERTADGIQDLKVVLVAHDVNEKAHHEESVRMLTKLDR